MHVILTIGTAFFFFSIKFCSGLLCNHNGSSTTLLPHHRKFVLDIHNDYRSLIAKGNATTNNGAELMAPAKNMYKLIYDCQLETVAQYWADGCRGLVHSEDGYRRAGENLFIIFGNGYNMKLEKAIEWAVRSWFEELDRIGMSATNTRFTRMLHESGMGHFTQLAWGKTTHIGCGIAFCDQNKTMLISCNYREKGNYYDDLIYDIGPPCRNDNECTTYANSTCDAEMGLCVVPYDFQPKLLGLYNTTIPTTTSRTTITTTASTTTTTTTSSTTEEFPIQIIENSTNVETTWTVQAESNWNNNSKEIEEILSNESNETLIAMNTIPTNSSTFDETRELTTQEATTSKTTEQISTSTVASMSEEAQEKENDLNSFENLEKSSSNNKPREEFKKAVDPLIEDGNDRVKDAIEDSKNEHLAMDKKFLHEIEKDRTSMSLDRTTVAEHKYTDSRKSLRNDRESNGPLAEHPLKLHMNFGKKHTNYRNEDRFSEEVVKIKHFGKI